MMPCTEVRPGSKEAGIVTLADIDVFDEIIDARSPSEYAEDHVPGAVNLPVLDDAERARVGTIYKQDSPFSAKKTGAALVSRNIAQHLETHFADKSRHYRPLVYCWRGGSRSGAMTHVLRSVGWNAAQLEGGYKAYRRAVIADLRSLPERFRFVVICGKTGVGKSRFLRAMARLGGQVLDLENLAAHMGSVLGAYPDRPQPPQKLFESRIWQSLRRFDPMLPVFVESESKKIGNLHTPGVLLDRMRASQCLTLEADLPVRVGLLKEEYAHYLAAPDSLNRQLDCLTSLLGRERIAQWQAMAGIGDWDGLVAALLVTHYDPAYMRSLGRNYPQAGDGNRLRLECATQEAISELARAAIEGCAAREPDPRPLAQT